MQENLNKSVRRTLYFNSVIVSVFVVVFLVLSGFRLFEQNVCIVVLPKKKIFSLPGFQQFTQTCLYEHLDWIILYIIYIFFLWYV